MPPADQCVVAIVGASAEVPPPGLDRPASGCEFRFAESPEQLAAIADADAAYIWPARVSWFAGCWGWSPQLRWVATSTVGVDWLLFPGLVDSDVVLTNSAGIFDEAMAEYAAALVLAVCADLPATLRLQHAADWVHRETRRLAGSEVVVAGAGGIGRAIARQLAQAGATVRSVGRSGRPDPELGWVAPITDLAALLPTADFVVLALPLTGQTAGLIGAAELARMRPGSWLINLARGPIVDEQALISALKSGQLGGAALDVFQREPLPTDSPLWAMPNVIVSPHMSGDFRGWERALVELFLAQLARFASGQPLLNVVDKRLGYLPATGQA